MTTENLLSVIELGGYPDFSPLYSRLGFAPVTVTSGRKAQAELKARRPAVLVAEFNFQRDFRDRTSALESLLAAAQRIGVSRIVVFYAIEDAEPLQRLAARFPGFTALAYPIDEERLTEVLTAP